MDSDSDADAATFSQELAALKRRGSTILVVGPVGEPTALHACRRLLGEGGPPPRRRVVATIDADPATDRRLPAGYDPSRVTVVESGVRTRGANKMAESSLDHEALEDDIFAAMRDQAEGDLAPAELRICLDSLRPLVAADKRRSQTLLGRFADVVVDHRAIGHVHLPVPYDHPAVDLLASYVDAVVELRDGDPPEQRWHLRSGVETGWLPL